MPTTKSTLFVVNKNEWYTKEGRGKSLLLLLVVVVVVVLCNTSQGV